MESNLKLSLSKVQGITVFSGAVGNFLARTPQETMRKRRLAMERKLSVSGDSAVRPVGLPQIFWRFFHI